MHHEPTPSGDLDPSKYKFLMLGSPLGLAMDSNCVLFSRLLELVKLSYIYNLSIDTMLGSRLGLLLILSTILL
jgi:hypothetical protein